MVEDIEAVRTLEAVRDDIEARRKFSPVLHDHKALVFPGVNPDLGHRPIESQGNPVLSGKGADELLLRLLGKALSVVIVDVPADGVEEVREGLVQVDDGPSPFPALLPEGNLSGRHKGLEALFHPDKDLLLLFRNSEAGHHEVIGIRVRGPVRIIGNRPVEDVLQGNREVESPLAVDQGPVISVDEDIFKYEVQIRDRRNGCPAGKAAVSENLCEVFRRLEVRFC